MTIPCCPPARTCYDFDRRPFAAANTPSTLRPPWARSYAICAGGGGAGLAGTRGVKAIAERLRARVAEALDAFAPGLDPRATIRIGVAMLSRLTGPQRIPFLIDAADRTVYAAKESGRNQVRIALVA